MDNTGGELTEQLTGAASAASGAAGNAASAVTGAAKSVMGAAMSVLGQGSLELDRTKDMDTNYPRSSKNSGGGGGLAGSRRTTPGKSTTDLADLGADIEAFRRRENKQPAGAGESLISGAKDVISTIITVDFFVVIAFMLWFIAGVVSSYGFSDTFLLDQFNDKWTPVVQPALGVLMGGTIAGGVASKFAESGGKDDDNNNR